MKNGENECVTEMLGYSAVVVSSEMTFFFGQVMGRTFSLYRAVTQFLIKVCKLFANSLICNSSEE